MHQAVQRRTFLEWRELPGLIVGVCALRNTSLRRVLGARRAGRVGVLLFALGLAAAATSIAAFVAGVVLHAVLGVGLSLAWRGRAALGIRAQLRLGAWTALLPLVIAAGLTAVSGAVGWAWAAVILGNTIAAWTRWRGFDEPEGV